jgi:hypothetical protein
MRRAVFISEMRPRHRRAAAPPESHHRKPAYALRRVRFPPSTKPITLACRRRDRSIKVHYRLPARHLDNSISEQRGDCLATQHSTRSTRPLSPHLDWGTAARSSIQPTSHSRHACAVPFRVGTERPVGGRRHISLQTRNSVRREIEPAIASRFLAVAEPPQPPRRRHADGSA